MEQKLPKKRYKFGEKIEIRYVGCRCRDLQDSACNLHLEIGYGKDNSQQKG